MLRIINRVFVVIGVLCSLIILLAIAGAVNARSPKEPKSIVLTLDFDRNIVEQEEPSPLDFAFNEKGTLTLFTILSAIDRARLDPHVKGIVARFGTSEFSMAQAQEIRSAIARFRTSDKFTYAYGVSYGDFGLTNRAYYLASAFENIWLQPVGAVSLTGIEIESPFGKSALDKLGVKADFMQREEYKSFMEMGQRDDFSPPVRIMMQGLINDLSNQLAEGIAESRKWPVEKVKDLMAEGPYTADEASKANLVTKIGYADELDDEIKQKAGQDVVMVSVDDFSNFHESTSKSENKSKATQVALIYASGLIATNPGGFDQVSGDKVMGVDDIVEAFDTAADNKEIKAILFRIDSPGGAPDASETIRRAMVHAQKKGKPVIVSMGSVAASGGYWIAMDGDYIVASPATLTGSIGVVGGKFVIADLTKKLGITISTLSTTPNAGMWSMTSEFTPGQRARVNALLDQTYHAFLVGVSEGRKIPMDKMPLIAKGRVWTGAQALKIGLVDELGGYDVALKAVRKKLDLKGDDPISLVQYPAPLTTAERIMKLFKAHGLESMIGGLDLSRSGLYNSIIGQFLKGVFSRSVITARAPDLAVAVIR